MIVKELINKLLEMDQNSKVIIELEQPLQYNNYEVLYGKITNVSIFGSDIIISSEEIDY